MTREVKYVGCFFSSEELQNALKEVDRNCLARIIKYPHVTFAYHPENINYECFGEKVSVEVIGYGNDGVNEGLQVVVRSGNPILNRMISKIEIPHITLSVSETGEPVDTKNLVFSPIKPFFIEGIFGAMTMDNTLRVAG